MMCWWFLGHKPLRLEIFGDLPFMTLGDDGGNLVDINLCVRCKLLYWEVSHAVTKEGRRATTRNDSVYWN